MFSRIEKYLKEKSKEIVFIQLKRNIELKNKGFVLERNVPLPIPLKDMVNKVNGNVQNSGFSILEIINGIILIIGIDSNFKYNYVYKKLLKAYDENIKDYIINKGINYAKANKKLDALICFKACLLLDEDNLNALYNYARCCEDLSIDSDKGFIQEFENEALEVFEIIAEKYPDFPLSYYHLGFYYANRRLYKKAEITWKTCLSKGVDEDKEMEILEKLSKINHKIQYEEGYTLILNNRPDEGLMKLLPLEEKYPEWWNLLFFIGLAYKQLKDFESAKTYFKKAYNIKPDNIDILNEIGICYMSSGDINEAIRYFKKALNIKEDNYEILCNLAIAYMENGEYKEAEKYIKKSYELNPQDEIVKACRERIRLLMDNKQ